MAAGFETLHDGIVCLNSVFILAGFEHGIKDCVGVAMLSDHDVLVAAARSDGESAAVVREELADGFVADVNFASFDGG